MSNKTYLIARREWLENIRTKTFWIGMLAFPIILTLALVVPTLLEKSKSARTYTVIDRSGWLFEEVIERGEISDLGRILQLAAAGRSTELLPADLLSMAENVADGSQDAYLLAASIISGEGIALDSTSRNSVLQWWRDLDSDSAKEISSRLGKAQYRYTAPKTQDPEALNQQIVDEEIFAYMIIDEDPIAAESEHRYVSSNLTDTDLQEWFSDTATDIIRERRMIQRDIDSETAAWLTSPMRFDRKRISETGEEAEVSATDTLRQWAPVAFVYILWFAIFSISQMLLTNTIEEKSNRLMEVLLSSVSPFQLMLGKIIGIAAIGLTMLLSWIIFLILAVKFLPQLLGSGSLPVDLTSIVSDPSYLISFIIYFVLGYLFYASLLVAIGSVCNTLKEAQNLMTPIIMVLIVPLLAMTPIAKDPNGSLAVIMSYIPPFTPFAMMNRVAGSPPMLDYILTTGLLLVSLLAVIWGAAKVFRVGVLMYGKPPKIREIFRWIKAPVGITPRIRKTEQEQDG